LLRPAGLQLQGAALEPGAAVGVPSRLVALPGVGAGAGQLRAPRPLSRDPRPGAAVQRAPRAVDERAVDQGELLVEPVTEVRSPRSAVEGHEARRPWMAAGLCAFSGLSTQDFRYCGPRTADRGLPSVLEDRHLHP